MPFLPTAAKNYPIYGVQFHPEKNGFEWIPDEAIPHSQHAVIIMQSLANFFVQEGLLLILPTDSSNKILLNNKPLIACQNIARKFGKKLNLVVWWSALAAAKLKSTKFQYYFYNGDFGAFPAMNRILY